MSLARIVFSIFFSTNAYVLANDALSNSIGEDPSRPKIHESKTLTIQAFFKAHCTKCHNADKKKGGINFLEWTDFRLENAKHWQEVLENLQRGDLSLIHI